MPYPHHADRHQYLNAEELAAAGAAVIVDDVAGAAERADLLWRRLSALMTDDEARRKMSRACGKAAKLDAAEVIARELLAM
jgi:UDP-N-acetylglucosamine:LPS N-acetylglucosamine transferase